jgi:putative transposase
VLPRLAYLVVTNTVTLLRVPPMSDRDRDIEILALRHQRLIPQRQIGKPTFTAVPFGHSVLAMLPASIR